MKKLSKIFWALCLVSFIILIAVRFIIGGWQNYLLLPLVLFVVSFSLALLVDVKFYIQFFTMKATKNGMSMGGALLLALALFVGLNIIIIKRNKQFDLTQNKIHSLSDQSLQILKNINSPLKVVYFYRGQQDSKTKADIGSLVKMYTQESSFVELQNINAYVDKIKADQYLKDMGKSQQIMLFIEHNNQRIRVESSISEATFTSALIKATRSGRKKRIAFLQGHGEKEILSSEDNGLSSLKQALEAAAFEVTSFSFVEGNEIPDADVVAVVGPLAEVFPGEQKQLIEFSQKGGGLIIAADPKEGHSLGQLMQKFGVSYSNDFILNEKSRVIGRGLSAAFGIMFDQSSAITKSFGQNFVLFDLASSLTFDKGNQFTHTSLVKSSPDSFLMKSLDGGEKSAQSHFIMAAQSQWKFSPEKPAAEAIFFGDSDFLSNKDIIQGLNMDLMINAVAYLTQENDLVSIKPKSVQATKFVLTSVQRNGVVIFCMAIPILFFILSVVFWMRRRSA